MSKFRVLHFCLSTNNRNKKFSLLPMPQRHKPMPCKHCSYLRLWSVFAEIKLQIGISKMKTHLVDRLFSLADLQLFVDADKEKLLQEWVGYIVGELVERLKQNSYSWMSTSSENRCWKNGQMCWRWRSVATSMTESSKTYRLDWREWVRDSSNWMLIDSGNSNSCRATRSNCTHLTIPSDLKCRHVPAFWFSPVSTCNYLIHRLFLFHEFFRLDSKYVILFWDVIIEKVLHHF